MQAWRRILGVLTLCQPNPSSHPEAHEVKGAFSEANALELSGPLTMCQALAGVGEGASGGCLGSSLRCVAWSDSTEEIMTYVR